MSRIGNKVITVPASVTVTVDDNNFVTVKGPKGELKAQISPIIKIEVSEGKIQCVRPDDTKESKTIHGTTRANLNNMVVGVSTGFQKQLSIIGTGYRAAVQGKKLVISAGYSHNVELDIPEGCSVDMPKNTEMTINGIDKQVLGQFAANVRGVRPPEPYKGKGIRYTNEFVRRKEGKKKAK